MRVNGRARPVGAGSLEVTTREVYSNRPKYIHPREVAPALGNDDADAIAERGTVLTPAQAAMLAAADTLFIASWHPLAGADVSHRGGEPGFVRVTAPGRIIIPDYSGNMMFNTLGNLAADPRAGLLLVDFGGSGTLQLSGLARIEWDRAALADFPGAERLVELRIDIVRWRTGAVTGS
jgi:predicted pyridoxine 5'-phosphate oxidase superfamily flavin-nucleotide-binding protein